MAVWRSLTIVSIRSAVSAIAAHRFGNWLGLEVYFSANNLFDQNRHTVYSNGPVGLGAGGHHSQIYITSGRRASLGIRARI